MFTQLNSIQIQSVIKIYSDAEKKGYWISIRINIFYYKNIKNLKKKNIKMVEYIKIKDKIFISVK